MIDPNSSGTIGLTSSQVGEALLPALMAELVRQKPPPYPSQGLIQRSFKLTATFRRDRTGEYHLLSVQAIPSS
jgi:hypothetical protein